MNRIAHFCAVVIAAFALAGAARAQDVSHGAQIYQGECFACHGPASADFHGIVTTGANNPGAILAAWLGEPSMKYLAGIYSAADRADIAAYLGTFLPPSGEIRASAAQLDFGTQPVGTPSAAQSISVSNFTGTVAITTVSSNNAAEFPIVADTCTGVVLAANATCRIDVAFTPAATGPRGTTISISNSGVVNPLSVTAIGTGGAAASVNYQGLWWNPSQSGWGINLAHQGDLIYLTWYTYDANGKASWLAMLASKTVTGTYSGNILEVHGSPYNVVPYNPGAKSVSTVGTGTLSFASATSGTFSYTARNVTASQPIARFPLSSPMPTCTYSSSPPNLAAATNYQDLWWNPAEDGWGVNVTHEGNVIYATWYTYDTDGSPLWLAALMTSSAPGTWSGSLLTGTGPRFGAAFDPSQVHLSAVGDAMLTFANGDAATLSYTIHSTVGTKSVTRFVFAPGGTVCR